MFLYFYLLLLNCVSTLFLFILQSVICVCLFLCSFFSYLLVKCFINFSNFFRCFSLFFCFSWFFPLLIYNKLFVSFLFSFATKWVFTFVSIFQMWRDGMLAVGEFLDVWWLSWHWRWDVQTKGTKKAQQTLTPNKSIYLKIRKI